MICDKADKVIEELSEPFLYRYQIRLETSMKGSDFIFDCVNLLYYKCHKICPNGDGLCIDSQDWIKNIEVMINPVNDVDKCFQYPATIAWIKSWRNCK